MRAPLTVVIPSSGTSDHLPGLLADLRAQSTRPARIHIVVNNRYEDARDAIRHATADVAVTYLTSQHYLTPGVNLALREVNTPFVSIINDDVRLTPTWAEAAITALDQHSAYGSLASRVLSARRLDCLDSCGDSLYRSGLATNNGWRETTRRWRDPCEVFSASGCLATYRTADLRQVGMFDDTFGAYLEDIDIGFRLQHVGRPCLFWPDAEASHIGGATRRGPRQAARLVERNAVLNIVKNLPTRLIIEYAPLILRTHSLPCTFEERRSVVAWLHGKIGGVRHLRNALHKRRSIQATRIVSDRYIDSIISPGRPAVCHL